MVNSNRTVAEVIAYLGETDEAPQQQIERAWTTCGEAFVQTLLNEVKEAELKGDLLTGDRKPRTRGGLFFLLLRRRVSPETWFFISHGRSRMRPSIALEWTERLEAIQDARSHNGSVSWVRVSAIGRVDVEAIETREGYVLVTLHSGDHFPPFPKGLPQPPSMASTFRVGIVFSQWREIERAVRGGDTLIVSGYPMPNEKKGSITVYAVKATTALLKQKKAKGWTR